MIEQKYYKMTQSELINSDFWLAKKYKETVVDPTIPIFVPSYNSYDNILLCKLMGKNMWPCTFVVRKSQEIAYLNNNDIIEANHKILAVDDDLISSAASVREYILNYCISNNIDNYITIDDDLIYAGFKIPYTTLAGKNSATVYKQVDFTKFCTMFYNMSIKAFEVDDHIAITGMKVRGNIFPSTPDVVDSDLWLHPCGNSTRSFVCINTKRFKDNDIHFDYTRGKLIHEDLDLLAQLILNGYYWATFEWMYYQDNGASLFAFNSMTERVESQTREMLDKYEGYDLFSVRGSRLGRKGQLKNSFTSINISGQKARKYLKNNFNIIPEKYISF